MVIYQKKIHCSPTHPCTHLFTYYLGVVMIKWAKVVVKCNEKFYLHYFEEMCNQLYLMNFLFIFWNCAFLFMRLKSHEFGVVSLYWKKLFPNKKQFLNNVFQHIWKFGCDFYYSDFYQLFSNLLQVLIYFIKRATHVTPFKSDFEFCVMILY
jgi:hypothetical protein